MGATIRIRKGLIDTLLAEARRNPLIECCGLLAGREGTVSEILPARNALVSATAYEIAPDELFALFRRMRERNLDHLGIYHSHPVTDNAPSPSDIAQAYYPGAAYFILTPLAEAARPVRAFRIAGGSVHELAIELV
jgi:[CysO sulfur-carrier protein]-S-L-cysteine hydrolase